MIRNLVICFVLLKSRMLVRYEINLLDGGFGDMEVGCFYIWEFGIDGCIIGWKCGWFESLVCGDIGLDLLLWMEGGDFGYLLRFFVLRKFFLFFKSVYKITSSYKIVYFQCFCQFYVPPGSIFSKLIFWEVFCFVSSENNIFLCYYDFGQRLGTDRESLA